MSEHSIVPEKQGNSNRRDPGKGRDAESRNHWGNMAGASDPIPCQRDNNG
jgi:hypothetical protein